MVGIKLRIGMILTGVILYQTVQYSFEFTGNVAMETFGILLILFALL